MGSDTYCFGDCARLIRDNVHPKEAIGTPYIGLEHIKEGSLCLIDFGKSEDVTSTKLRFCEGDILFGKLRPYFRKVIRAPFDGVCSTEIWVVRAKSGVDKGYLYYWMASQSFVDFSMQGSEGTRMPRAKWEHVIRHEQPKLKFHEQKAIAYILESLDDKIELNRRMNVTLEAIVRAIFKSWFVDFDPVWAKVDGRHPIGMDAEIAALFPDSFEDSALGKIPRRWRVRKVADIAHVIDCLHSKKPVATDEGKHFLQVYNVGQTGRLDLTESYFISEADYTEWTKRIEVRHNDLVITKTGRVGAVARIRRGFKAAIGRNIVAIRAEGEECTPLFLKDCFLSNQMRREITSKTSNGTILRSLHVKAIEILNVVMPPLPLARKYDQLVKDIHDKLDQNDEEIETLSELRDALLPKLLSGEIRIKDSEKFAENVS